ncbi:hypothetical protein MARBORIA2_09630 [Methanobrevibacter arboriphilus]|uniref:Uncharacterized protein n=3 Tax=Methanobrevibacter arboriphilus TaxID=39441 RepID=A0ACA8R3J5_METAZ|nr:PadR family transcriptional regulator [Methanobrevibacter arboriphilus]BBL62095.1 hypothetical protein MarbSA_11350 [Methanobrevibacter arboriphilus]GLI11873.1 hypothetical protein MARBORIA2_09630 [Methanobrevibacter arboriphilus]
MNKKTKYGGNIINTTNNYRESGIYDDEIDKNDDYKENDERFLEKNEDFPVLGEFDKTLILGVMKGFLKIIVLWIITKERIHGYEIIKKMKEGNTTKKLKFKGPGPNKIYPILHELEKKGLIKGDWEFQGKRKLKFYEATEKGVNTIELIKKKPHRDVPPILKEFWRDVIVPHKNAGKDCKNQKEC